VLPPEENLSLGPGRFAAEGHDDEAFVFIGHGFPQRTGLRWISRPNGSTASNRASRNLLGCPSRARPEDRPESHRSPAEGGRWLEFSSATARKIDRGSSHWPGPSRPRRSRVLGPEDSARLDLAHVLDRELAQASCVLVVWSTSSIDSPWVLEEAEFGKERGALVPVRLDPVAPPIGFRAIQAADLTHWNGSRDDPASSRCFQ